jgi:hypothetical protein
VTLAERLTLRRMGTGDDGCDHAKRRMAAFAPRLRAALFIPAALIGGTMRGLGPDRSLAGDHRGCCQVWLCGSLFVGGLVGGLAARSSPRGA